MAVSISVSTSAIATPNKQIPNFKRLMQASMPSILLSHPTTHKPKQADQ
jgi:hypothetical protein